MFEKMGSKNTDFGCESTDTGDFPDIARKVCNAVRNGTHDRRIIICGTGVGATIAANKIPGFRASVCHDIHTAHQGVEHDDVNIMCIGADHWPLAC